MAANRKSRSELAKKKADQPRPKRTKRPPKPLRVDITPYDGRKYWEPQWDLPINFTERAVQETYVVSDRKLTNDQVRSAFISLIRQLTGDVPPFDPDEPLVTFQAGREVEYLIRQIRLGWQKLFEAFATIKNSDLIGILRTLLFSIEAHNHNTGKDKGYVAYLDSPMSRINVIRIG